MRVKINWFNSSFPNKALATPDKLNKVMGVHYMVYLVQKMKMAFTILSVNKYSN
jgi:hypothetical protein